MKTLLIVSISLALFVSCCTKTDTRPFVGNWIEVMPVNTQYVQGVTLNADGTASSIGMATLLYNKWEVADGKMILWGESVGNGQTIEFADTMNIIKLTADSLILGKFGMYQIAYYKVADPAAVKPFNVVDSLTLHPDLGDVAEREFQGLLPAASCPGIEYTLLLYNQPNCGDGVYKLTMKYLEAENGKDATYVTYGRQYTLRGDAENINATVYQLVAFDTNENTNFLYDSTDGSLELLNSKLERAKSELNYKLKPVNL